MEKRKALSIHPTTEHEQEPHRRGPRVQTATRLSNGQKFALQTHATHIVNFVLQSDTDTVLKDGDAHLKHALWDELLCSAIDI